MFHLATTPPDQTTGTARALFDRFAQMRIDPPAPLRLMTASPGLLEVQAGNIGYFAGHKALGFPLLAAIRYLGALRFNAPACVDFNSGLLAAAGFTGAEVAGLADDPASAPLEPREAALLAFVARALAGGTSADDLDALRAHGWTDADILDAVAHAAHMQVPALTMRTFAR